MTTASRSTGTMGSSVETHVHYPTLVLRFAGQTQETVENRVEKLHTTIDNSNLLPPEMVPECSIFCESTPEQLGLFLLNIIEPAIVCYENDAEAQNTLLSIHEELKQVIQKLLPAGKRLRFFRKCEKLTDKAIKGELRQAHLQEQAEKMVETANEINQVNMSLNQELNNRIRQINDQRALALIRLNSRLDPLQRKLQDVYTMALNASPEIKSLCQRMEMGEMAIQQLLQQCEAVVNGVRV